MTPELKLLFINDEIVEISNPGYHHRTFVKARGRVRHVYGISFIGDHDLAEKALYEPRLLFEGFPSSPFDVEFIW